VTVEQYLTLVEHVVNDKESKDKAECFLPYFFQAIDHDHDGVISLKEFKIFYQCLGLSEEDAAVAFHIIDHNDDGKLSQKEFEYLGKDFFLTEDEKRVSRMFWGPLIEH
jgi:Ca2+-binding EF-hand superfamily protein